MDKAFPIPICAERVHEQCGPNSEAASRMVGHSEVMATVLVNALTGKVGTSTYLSQDQSKRDGSPWLLPFRYLNIRVGTSLLLGASLYLSLLCQSNRKAEGNG